MTKSSENKMLTVAAISIACMVTFYQFQIDEFLVEGRSLHFFSCLFIFLLTYFLPIVQKYKLLVAITATLFIGLIKELSDPTFDNYDMFANVTGVMLGLTIITFGLCTLKISKRA